MHSLQTMTTCVTSSIMKINSNGFKTAKNRQTNNDIKRSRRFIITVQCNKIAMPYFNNILTYPSKRSIRNSFHRKEFRRKGRRESIMATAVAA